MPGVREAARKLREFVADNEIRILNVAGPKESGELEVGELSGRFLRKCS